MSWPAAQRLQIPPDELLAFARSECHRVLQFEVSDLRRIRDWMLDSPSSRSPSGNAKNQKKKKRPAAAPIGRRVRSLPIRAPSAQRAEGGPAAAKAFDALLLFVRNAERLVRRDELVEALWPDTYVLDTKPGECDRQPAEDPRPRRGMPDGLELPATGWLVPVLGQPGGINRPMPRSWKGKR